MNNDENNNDNTNQITVTDLDASLETQTDSWAINDPWVVNYYNGKKFLLAAKDGGGSGCGSDGCGSPGGCGCGGSGDGCPGGPGDPGDPGPA